MHDRNTSNLRNAADGVRRVVAVIAYILHAGSAIFTGGATYLHLSEQGDNFFAALAIAALIGIMTLGVLIALTRSIISILPFLAPKYQMIGAVIAALGLGGMVVLSGTSNAVFLSHGAAERLQDKEAISAGEAAFSKAQNTIRQLEQILPLLATGKETARLLKDIEDRGGVTGSGKGPIYNELVTQENRLGGAEDGIRQVIADAGTKIEAGQATLVAMRAALAKDDVSREERRRLVENGLTRLSTIVIELRQQMPLASLDAVASMLKSPITLPSYSSDPEKRRLQQETIARLHREFQPIGIALADAVRGLSEELPGDVPAYRHLPPTALVFAHYAALFWIISLGYSLDVLPYLALGMLLLAQRQIDEERSDTTMSGDDDRTPPPTDPRPRGYRRPYGDRGDAHIHRIDEERRKRLPRPNGHDGDRRA